MSANDGEIFAFDSNENLSGNSSVERVDLMAECPETLRTPLNYQTARRIERVKNILRDRSLMQYQSLKTGEPMCLVRAKLLAMLSPNWTIEKEKQLFSNDGLASSREYTIVTPSHSFIEMDDVPYNSSFVSSYSAKTGSYKSATFSPASFKSPDRQKKFK